jgi:SAM-dependent methyltransferase
MDIDPDFYDAELRLHNAHLRAAANVQPHDRVLDVGCGTGQTTREAARAAEYGSALGVDPSAPMLERARRLSDHAGLRNVTYVQADAQTHPFPPAHFELCISRFGTMFFADPVAAFANIGQALRPGARLVQLVWQDHDRNEWAAATRDALTAGTAAPAPTTNDPGPFSLADPAITAGILAAAGFAEVDFTDVHEPVFYGPDTATAYDAVLRLRHAKDLLADLDPTMTGHALERLRATVAAHNTGSGVFFGARAWLVAAVRRPNGPARA